MMEEAIEHGRDGRTISQQFAPVFDGSIGIEQSTGAFIKLHDDLREFPGGSDWQLAHAQIIDDEERNRSQQFHMFLAGPIDGRFRQVVEQFVGLAIQHAIDLLNDSLPDGLSKMTFPGAGRILKINRLRGISLSRPCATIPLLAFQCTPSATTGQAQRHARALPPALEVTSRPRLVNVSLVSTACTDSVIDLHIRRDRPDPQHDRRLRQWCL
jgi:hypothetical protein